MPLRTKLPLAVLVLGVGVGLAFVFRKAPSSDDVGQPDGDRLVLRDQSVAPAPWSAGTAPAPSWLTQKAEPQQVEAPKAPTAALVEPEATQPNLPPAFDRNRVALVPRERSPGPPVAVGAVPNRMADARAFNPAVSASPGEGAKTHKVVDGDTLERLAQYYLGRGDRAVEIFEANRQKLSNPDLLPIGVVLTIPPRENSARARNAADQPPLREIPPGSFRRGVN